nr:MAG TPA: hypothetical protein [Caudoviricetes sp.]
MILLRATILTRNILPHVFIYKEPMETKVL